MTTQERVKAMNAARDTAKAIRERDACPNCTSKNIIAKRDGTSWCRRCGNEWKR